MTPKHRQQSLRAEPSQVEPIRADEFGLASRANLGCSYGSVDRSAVFGFHTVVV